MIRSRDSRSQSTVLAIFCLVLAIFVGQVVEGAALNRQCQKSTDCNSNQCCTETPNGPKICLNYEQQGERCFFRVRTPSCGCAQGLRCVSTSPMEPGYWNHEYVCSKVRPFQHYKQLPYLDETNEVLGN